MLFIIEEWQSWTLSGFYEQYICWPPVLPEVIHIKVLQTFLKNPEKGLIWITVGATHGNWDKWNRSPERAEPHYKQTEYNLNSI